MNLKQKLEQDFLLGCIKYREQYSYYAMPIAFWILNYAKYDPKYKPEDWEDIFRDNILNVTDDQINNFIKAIDADRISDLEELKSIKPQSEYTYIYFFIDFDSITFVSHFDDIEIEEYLPHDEWRSIFEYPINRIPEKDRNYFYQILEQDQKLNIP